MQVKTKAGQSTGTKRAGLLKSSFRVLAQSFDHITVFRPYGRTASRPYGRTTRVVL